MKKLTLAAILAGCFATAFAQTETTPATKHEKTTDQYFGVQLNGLIRQIFNFNNGTSSTVVNPYLLTYNINSRKTGWGLRVGVGANYSSTWSDDGVTQSSAKLNDLELRVGVEKAFVLSEKWSAGVGLDLLFNSNDDNSSSTIRSFDTVTTTTKTVTTSYGGGAMAWLRYNITPHISVGTETSAYYTTGKQTVTTDVTQRVNNGFSTNIVTTETITKPTISNGTITLPIAFYLAVKF